MATDTIPQIQARLNALKPTIARIRRRTGAPSTSVGVLHGGEVIFTCSEGFRDFKDNTIVNVDTAYLLGSLTKAFIASSCGILVDEGILDWNKPLSAYVPFHQKHDPVISERATLSDALSHSTGFPQIDIAWYGAKGDCILGNQDLIHVVNHIPVHPDFRSKFHYSNWMYALAGRVIEAVGGPDAQYDRWGGFVRRRIFDPLGMTRSVTNRARLPDDNIAEPHTVLDSGEPARLPRPRFSDQSITGAAGAVWSTVPNMLSWAKALLDGLENEPLAKSLGNPLRQLSRIFAHHFPVTTDTIEESTYGYGWARNQIPSTRLGWLSTNGPAGSRTQYLLGKDSRPRLTFYHGSQMPGYLNSIYLFPETKSAVIVLTNAQSLGDASDWTAQAVIQALFDLQPHIDFAHVAGQTAKKHLLAYDKMMADYEGHRIPTLSIFAPPLRDFVGTFFNDDISMMIEIFLADDTTAVQNRSGIGGVGGRSRGIDLRSTPLAIASPGPSLTRTTTIASSSSPSSNISTCTPTRTSGPSLSLCFNHRGSQTHRLRHYHFDTFGFPPSSREELESRCLVNYAGYEQWLLEFQRDKKGKVVSLQWRMEPGLEKLRFLLEPY